MRYLVWDFDGTLGYREGGWSGACRDVLRNEAGISVEVADIRPYLASGFPWHSPEDPHNHSTPSEWWEELAPVLAAALEGQGVEPNRSAELVTAVRSTYVEDGWRRYDDSVPALETLASQGWRHLVLSNHVPELDTILEQLDLRSYFEAMYVSAEIGYEKPHPRAFEPVLRHVEDGATTWMIGDSYRADVQGAESVGIDGILVRGAHPDATNCCETLSEVHDVVAEE